MKTCTVRETENARISFCAYRPVRRSSLAQPRLVTPDTRLTTLSSAGLHPCGPTALGGADRDAAERDSAERDAAERNNAERDAAERDAAERDVATSDGANRDSAAERG